jgi:TonB family protein
MAFRALLFSKSPETTAAMTAACESTGIRAEVCSDIFSAIEKAKSRAFSCVIPDWSDQPEASFLLKRARESSVNRDTVGIAIVDNEPTSAEMRENRLDFLIYRPISVEEADAVLTKACEQMQALSAQDAAEQPEASHADSTTVASVGDGHEQDHQNQPTVFEEASGEESGDIGEAGQEEPWTRHGAPDLRKAFAAVAVLAAVFFLWRASATIVYLARTPEGAARVIRESAAALFYMNQTGALPVSSAGSDAQQDAYFSRGTANSNAQTPALGVAATESNLVEARIPLPKAFDFPLPEPTLMEQQQAPPVRLERVAIPDSMRNSPPIARPVVVTVSPAQMMPVSAPQIQPIPQQISEPVALSEQAARAMLVHSVDPVYPPEGLAQKLHGPVVLQALIARDGSVEDLKIVRGYFVLGKAAIAAVKQWRFQPYTVDGRAASAQTVITVNFNSPPG